MVLMPDDPRQMFFISRAEMVSGEDLVLAVGEVVDWLDLSVLYGYWSEKGRGFYDPAMMLKVLFFAYCDGERRSGEIAKKINYDVRYQYFAGRRRPRISFIRSYSSSLRPCALTISGVTAGCSNVLFTTSPSCSKKQSIATVPVYVNELREQLSQEI
jgi:hypothetical protein